MFNNSPDTPVWQLWDTMIKLYSNRWITKNGNRPNELWIAQIASMTAAQVTAVCQECIKRCASGNSWPPDLAEFIELMARCQGGIFGLNSKRIMAEYWRWRKSGKSAAEFLWQQPLLFQICTEMFRTGSQRNLTEKELEKFGADLLSDWERKVASGCPIPPVRAQINAPKTPSGPTPAEELLARRRKSAS